LADRPTLAARLMERAPRAYVAQGAHCPVCAATVNVQTPHNRKTLRSK
jgi:hypothetical protein